MEEGLEDKILERATFCRCSQVTSNCFLIAARSDSLQKSDACIKWQEA